MNIFNKLLCKTCVQKWLVKRLDLKVELSLNVELINNKNYMNKIKKWKNQILTVHLPFLLENRWLNIAACQDSWRNKSLRILQESIEIVFELNADKIIIHTAPKIIEGKKVSDYDRLIEGINHIADKASKKNLIVCVENNRTYWNDSEKKLLECIDRTKIKRFYAQKPQEWINIIEDTNKKNIKLCLDTSHAVTNAQRVFSLAERNEILNNFLSAEQHISHVHWSDNYFVDKRGRNDSHLPLNTGSIPLDIHHKIANLPATLLLEHNINGQDLLKEMNFIHNNL